MAQLKSGSTVGGSEIYHTGNAGTAAASDVTTSSTDTTAGRLLKVGDFGVGGSGVGLSNIDASTTPTGDYRYSSSTSGTKPDTSNDGVVSISRINTSETTQLAHSYTTDSLHKRQYKANGSGWSPWREIYHTGNLFTSTTAPGNAPLYACRAWVNFNGVGGVSVRGGQNFSSITRISAGLYELTFSSALPDNNYAVTGSCTRTDLNNPVPIFGFGNDFPTVNKFRVQVGNTANSREDGAYVHVAVFR